MGFTFGAEADNHDESGSAQATVGVQLTGVSAGDLIVVYVKWQDNVTCTVSDGTSSLTGLTRRVLTNSLNGQFFYILASVASGSVTYTATFSGVGATYPRIFAHRVAYTGTCAFDQENGNTGTITTSLTSGSITTTNESASGSGIVFASFSESDAVTTSSEAIFGTAADASFDSNNFATTWYRIIAAAATGQATATLSSSNEFVSAIAAFKDTAGGGGGSALGPLIGGRLTQSRLTSGRLIR